MGGLVEKQLTDATEAYFTNNIAVAQTVRRREKQVNQYEVDLDINVTNVIAKRQPTAGDLRVLLSLLKSSTDLERIGDESNRIAKLTIGGISAKPDPTIQQTLHELVDRTAVSLHASLDAVARPDIDVARDLIDKDSEIDELYNVVLKSASKAIGVQPAQTPEFLTVLWIARALERIGDHSKNIAENTVFLISGEYIKHLPKGN